MWYRTVGCIVTLTLSLLVALLVAEAQPTSKVPRIGFLANAGQRLPCSDPGFLEALHALGYVEGRTIMIEWRCPGEKTEQVHQFAHELVQLGVDVIVSSARAGTLALKDMTHTIPIVFHGNGEPVPAIVPNLAHPDGNVTGVANISGWEYFAKQLELLREAVPGMTRVALLLVEGDPFNADRITPVETAARAVGVQVHRVEVAGSDDYEGAFAAMARQGVEGLLVSFTPLFGTHSAQLGALAAKYRLPAIFEPRAFAVQGGLLSHYPVDLWRPVASYVDRILKGAKPADLPVQLPTKYKLVINLKTAQALGITLPPTLLIQADEVIR
jgi:putative ABC transport system substrate-binding protein